MSAPVYVVDQSRQTTRISANVSGLLGTERISLNDNLLRRCAPAEIDAVLGHEMGRYVLNHVYKNLLEIAIVVAIGFSLRQSSGPVTGSVTGGDSLVADEHW